MVNLVIPPFGGKVSVFTDKAEAAATIMEVTGKDETEFLATSRGAAFMHHANDCAYLSLYLPKRYNERVVWHEALHCSWDILHKYGVEIDHHNHEIQAHLQGFIVREIKREVYKMKVKEPHEE